MNPPANFTLFLDGFTTQAFGLIYLVDEDLNQRLVTGIYPRIKCKIKNEDPPSSVKSKSDGKSHA